MRLSERAALYFLKINHTVRSFVEKKVDGGQIGPEAVFLGKDLEIRLFQFQGAENVIRTFRMDRFAQVAAADDVLTVVDNSLAGILGSESYVSSDACLVKQETEYGSVQVYESFWFFRVYGEELIHVVLEVCGCPVRGNDGPFMLLEPDFAPIYADL